MRPLSRMAMRSCTHSKGLPVVSCARRKPAQPPSCGSAANNSESVGLGGAGTCQGSPTPFGSARGSTGSERTTTAPPATRDQPLATRLTIFSVLVLFLFRDSMAGVNPATRPALGIELFQELLHFADYVPGVSLRNSERHVMAAKLSFLVALLVESAG